MIPLIPAKAGTQCFGRTAYGASADRDPAHRGFAKTCIPAFAGMHGNVERKGGINSRDLG